MKEKPKTVVLYIDVMERYHFFKKFFNPLSVLYNPYIITGRLSIYFLCRLHGVKVLLLKNISSDCKPNKLLENSLSVLNHYHTKREAEYIFCAIQSQLSTLHKELSIESFFVWNGSTTIAKAIGDFAKQYKVKTYFFEISNLGNKIFVDRQGVNAQSYLYEHPDLLDMVEVSDEAFFEWKEKWKKDLSNPKQVKNTTKVPLSFFIDLIGFYISNALREDRRGPFDIIKKKFFLKNSLSEIELSKNLPEEFLFLAMQVSDDSQLILNSDVDNLQALGLAIDFTKKEGIKLVVKLHPAEASLSFIEHIKKEADKSFFILSNRSTKELIKKAKKIIVINSTVGIEAMINEKEVIVLGRALYDKFDYKRLKSYILNYLIDIDYFRQDEKVSTSTLNKVMKINEL